MKSLKWGWLERTTPPHTGRQTLSYLGMQRHEHLMKQSSLTRGSITRILNQSYQQLSDDSQNHLCRSHNTGPQTGRPPLFPPFQAESEGSMLLSLLEPKPLFL